MHDFEQVLGSELERLLLEVLLQHLKSLEGLEICCVCLLVMMNLFT